MAYVVHKETYKVMSYLKNQSWNVAGGNTNEGTHVLSWNHDNNGTNSKWMATKEGDGYYSFTPRNLPQGSERKSLDASLTTKGEVVIWPFGGCNNQLWALEPCESNFYLCYVRNKDGGYLQFNGNDKDLSVAARTGGPEQKWSFQEVSSSVCADAEWFDSLTNPKAVAERERIERERIEYERTERERVERDRIEHDRLEAERIERERIERERLEQERLERDKREKDLNEKDRQLAELQARLAQLELEQSKKLELQWAQREREIAEREKRIALLELQRREQSLKDRGEWITGRDRVQSELTRILIIIQTSGDAAELDKARADKARLELELKEYDKKEREIELKEKVVKEQVEKLELEKKEKEAWLKSLEATDKVEAIRQREIWLIHLEETVRRLGKITIKYVVVPPTTSTVTKEVHVIPGDSTTTHTRTVEIVGGERVTKDVEVVETGRVIKTVEYK